MPRATNALRHAFGMAILVFCACAAPRESAAQVAVPPELEGWRGWVLQDQEHRRCPFLSSGSADDRESYRCVWPERLSIRVDAQGGAFALRWRVFTESWVQLPGSLEHWPQDVEVNGKPGAVVARDGAPMVRLPAGNHVTTGRWAWSTRPESLPVAPNTALVDLTLDGRPVPQPERPGGAIWLGKRRAADQPQRLEVQVYRLVRDEVPVRLVTRIRLQASGEGREELLARVLPDGFVPLGLESTLPARLEPDGRMRVQVRAGSWELTLDARGTTVASQLKRPPVEGLWAREEIWSFAGNDRLRVAAAQGAEGIDPVQANVPPEWRGFPAFRMAQDTTLVVSERSRGLENADDNRLTLNRRLWLDFDHGGFTSVDRIHGTLRRDWRLDMHAPFRLESARSGQETLLVTRSAEADRVGVEVRTPRLDLVAVARSSQGRGALPATGWNARFERVDGVLNLPPGHRLLAALGADRAPTSWMEQWGLWGLFGVLIVAVFVGWLAGRPLGAVALAALLLTYQESPAYIWLWSNLLAAIALARSAPEGRLLRLARAYRTASFAVLAIALLPLLWGQLRLALYPQLDAGFFARQPVPHEAASLQADTAEEIAAAPPAAAEADGQAMRDAIRAAPEPRRTAKAAPPVPTAQAGLNYAQVIQRYAPGTVLQAGPGIPAWSYEAYPYTWSGPVEPEQTVRFIYIGPVLLGLWRIAGVALLAVLFAALLSVSDQGRWRWPGGGAFGAIREMLTRRGTAAASVVACAIGIVLAGAAHGAQAAPDAATLDELKRRLTRPPACSPTCAEIMSAVVSVEGDRADIALEVSALANVAIPVPSANDRWQIDTLTVDGKSSLAVRREADRSLWIPLAPGAHAVRLAGTLAPAESIQLAFPAVPRRVSVRAQGWDASGLNDSRLLSGTLELVRRRTAAQGPGALEAASEFPPFVNVRRHFNLDLDWNLTTVVERVAPESAALSVEVPLVAGESVLSEGMQVRETPDGRRFALVGLERGQSEARWISGLARAESLELEFPASSQRAETWSFIVSPQWHVVFEGLPAVLPPEPDAPVWTYEFHPRPGERLKASITRPAAAEGRTLAIDSVEHRTVFGKRSSTATMRFQYRSTQGGRHTISLPEAARVSSVRLDGRAMQLRPDNGELSIGLMPGSHSVLIEWQEPTGVRARARPASVDLHTPASNINTRIELPSDRWPLFAAGPGVGPVVMYWVELAVFLVTAWLLGRVPLSPLKTHEWLLLGLGLSTLSWGIFALVALWLFAMRWRERWAGNVARSQFNLVQALLAAFTVIAVATLVFSGVRQSLLASPNMGVAGPGSYGMSFSWFLDQTRSALPAPYVLSVPLWVYRAFMFAWALWIAVALLRWLRWAWGAWKANGLWRGELEAPVAGSERTSA